jgi:DNA primase large subunit
MRWDALLTVAHALSRSEDLRRRFVKAETTLFRIRYDTDDKHERDEFLDARNFDWLSVRTRGSEYPGKC